MELTMKIISLLTLLLMLSSCGGALVSNNNHQVEIDPQLFQKLASKQQVSILVLLNFTETNDRPKEAQIFDLQEKVLKKLPSNEFKLQRRYSSIPGFSGKISKKGLNILKSNPNVLRISVNKAYNTM